MENDICKGTPAIWIVIDVKPQPDYTLILTFVSGEIKKYNFKPLLKKETYAPLNDLSFFLTARVIGDSVGWNDEIDIAPEFLYENSESIGYRY